MYISSLYPAYHILVQRVPAYSVASVCKAQALRATAILRFEEREGVDMFVFTGLSLADLRMRLSLLCYIVPLLKYRVHVDPLRHVLPQWWKKASTFVFWNILGYDWIRVSRATRVASFIQFEECSQDLLPPNLRWNESLLWSVIFVQPMQFPWQGGLSTCSWVAYAENGIKRRTKMD